MQLYGKVDLVMNPVTWKRPAGKYIRYDSQKQLKNSIGLLAKSQLPKSPTPEPLYADLFFFFTKPKSNKTPFPQHRRDCDNLSKLLLDSLNNIAYQDDGQIIRLQVTKLWTTNSSHIKIFLYTLNEHDVTILNEYIKLEDPT